MKKSNKNYVKRITSLIVATVGCASMSITALNTFAATPVSNASIVAPANIIITSTENDFVLKSGGIFECYGETNVPVGYTAYVSVALQQKGSSWSSIKTWSDKGGSNAFVDEKYAVAKGYSYRLKLTHKAYDSSGNLIETITKYSDVINY